MLREIDLSKVTDNKLYGKEDEVTVPCDSCAGCSECCQTVGDTIILDPLDIYNLSIATGRSFAEMMESVIEIRMVDGLILPNMMMNEETGGCNMLDSDGRCGIHKLRPGFCRLFPLGRLYDENGNFKYILQINECDHPVKGPVRVCDWLGINDLDTYESFVKEWHAVLKDLTEKADKTEDEMIKKHLSWLPVRVFFEPPYDKKADFYKQFRDRLRFYGTQLSSMGIK